MSTRENDDETVKSLPPAPVADYWTERMKEFDKNSVSAVTSAAEHIMTALSIVLGVTTLVLSQRPEFLSTDGQWCAFIAAAILILGIFFALLAILPITRVSWHLESPQQCREAFDRVKRDKSRLVCAAFVALLLSSCLLGWAILRLRA